MLVVPLVVCVPLMPGVDIICVPLMPGVDITCVLVIMPGVDIICVPVIVVAGIAVEVIGIIAVEVTAIAAVGEAIIAAVGVIAAVLALVAVGDTGVLVGLLPPHALRVRDTVSSIDSITVRRPNFFNLFSSL